MTRNRGKETPAAVTQHLSPSQTGRALPRFTSVRPDCFHRGVLSPQHWPALFWHAMTPFPRLHTMLDGLWFCCSPIHAKSTQLTALPFSLPLVLETRRLAGRSCGRRSLPSASSRLSLRVNLFTNGPRALATSSVSTWHNLGPVIFSNTACLHVIQEKQVSLG